MHTKRADWSRLHSLYNISLCLMPAQQHWLVKDAFKHSLQRCAVHAHCLVNYAQSLHKLVKKKQLAGVSALFWFMTRRGRGGGESEDSHLIGTLWPSEQQFRGLLKDPGPPPQLSRHEQEVCLTYDCACAWQDSAGGGSSSPLTPMCRRHILSTGSMPEQTG